MGFCIIPLYADSLRIFVRTQRTQLTLNDCARIHGMATESLPLPHIMTLLRLFVFKPHRTHSHDTLASSRVQRHGPRSSQSDYNYNTYRLGDPRRYLRAKPDVVVSSAPNLVHNMLESTNDNAVHPVQATASNLCEASVALPTSWEEPASDTKYVLMVTIWVGVHGAISHLYCYSKQFKVTPPILLAMEPPPGKEPKLWASKEKKRTEIDDELNHIQEVVDKRRLLTIRHLYKQRHSIILKRPGGFGTSPTRLFHDGKLTTLENNPLTAQEPIERETLHSRTLKPHHEVSRRNSGCSRLTMTTQFPSGNTFLIIFIPILSQYFQSQNF
ncbi:uncharacterized protein BDR25DRAFT_354605 [Lindgomyces ingoldianus]|uniref:Uncharacterized protein n=1 Tax=Lindgomyces ingoldianus TaxID=673940 RepID=A0ACB6QWV4_9PLEO|nr:uncharacterized protein BDR25DRAFT_354605 [Lindgomyces ingoldianus]KAF2471360.1 hypothetical protein BDR25DRAFT_354605 [Lindgomyces ingoldianus]